MDQITKFAVQNSRSTILALLCIIIAGINTFITMPSQEDPEVTIREAQVTASFPGMPTDQVENLIAKPLEKKIKEIPEIEKIKTTVRTGQVTVQVKVFDQYFDLAPIWQNLRNKMADMAGTLPEGTYGPNVNDDFGRVSVATVAMTGDGFTMKEMREVALHLQDKISALQSVSKVSVMGVQNEQISITVNAERLAQFGLIFTDLMQQLVAQNVVLPGGSINSNGKEVAIEPTGNLTSLEELKNVQVTLPETNQVVYLQDIADVRRGYVYPSEYAAFYNDKPAVVLAVSMVPRYNIEEFGSELTAYIKALQDSLPLGLQLDYATYQPTLVTTAVNSAVSNLYQTVGVVLVVVVIFLGLRTGLIVSAIVPLTILLSFVVMDIWGIDLQRMSIAAIIIALGLLVDNGIVIAEDMRSQMDKGISAQDAANQSARSLGIPLLTSSLTTILAFMPLMMANDSSGEYLRSLSQVIIIALLSSWLLAMYATPTLCCWFLQQTPNDNVKPETTNYSGGLYKWYAFFLAKLLKFKVGFVLLMGAVLVVSLMGLGKIPKQMMPYSDRNQFLVYLDLPAGTNVEKTKEVTRRLTAWLSDEKLNPQVESSIAYVGYGGPRFFLSLSPPNAADNVAFLVINTDSKEDVLPMVNKVDAYILEHLPEVRGRSKRMSLGASEIGLVEYRIIGPDVSTLYRIGRMVEAKMKSIEGSVGVLQDWSEPTIRIRVNIDQDRARRAGVTSKSIAQSLNAYFEGRVVTHFREGDQSIPIVVQGGDSRNDLSALKVLPVLSDSGQPVPLVQVADFEGYIAPDKFKRFNQERTLTVAGKHRYMQATDFHTVIWPMIQEIDLPHGYRIEVGGEVESSETGNAALAENLPFAIIGIIVLLVLQFNSFRRPAIIMLTIPLVVIGAVLGLTISGAFFSFTGLLGIYSLVGIIVNNGIVLIDRIDIERAQGKDIDSALIDACMARARPILMTTLTTILGLIPMALFGGAMWYPMAVVIMGGLAVGSVLTLGFVPVLYRLFFPGSGQTPEVAQ
ncbi:efflux RND transporter permease subunit [Pseudoalteromonas peptidolytica]|uniref:efflux RND transporter permease subunit n=1 Tax=Pseudoalteromonas peptidolytica TaxID=61150 RepID=UPI00298E8B16|nr:efflux RND transporter permease subunit [Pseudoalteromonas peptidolytica]MDW7550401.1 efflux RND transporter permease subunit [Pseudoalteromonas peptidolytica]